MLPALSAALIGALTAGAATFMANSQSVADAGQVSLAVENQEAAEPGFPQTDDPIGSASTELPSGGEPVTEDNSPTSDPPPSTSEQAKPTSTTPADPTSATPTPPATSTSRPQVTQEEQVVALVNAAREQSGCDPVRIVPALVTAAQAHSEDMAERDYFDHTTPDGVGFAERIVAAGYPNPGAENIARGQRSATQVMNSWMESDGHRANILNCQLTTIGVGLEKDGWYWTQNFGY